MAGQRGSGREGAAGTGIEPVSSRQRDAAAVGRRLLCLAPFPLLQLAVEVQPSAISIVMVPGMVAWQQTNLGRQHDAAVAGLDFQPVAAPVAVELDLNMCVRHPTSSG